MSIKTRWDKDYSNNWDSVFKKKCSCGAVCDESGHRGFDPSHPGLCCKCYEESITSTPKTVKRIYNEVQSGIDDAKAGLPPAKLTGLYFDGYVGGLKICSSSS